MEFQVKEVGIIEPKSVQQVEAELLEKHEAELNGELNEPINEEPLLNNEPINEPIEAEELTEDKVLSFIKNKYNKEINSFDELMEQRSESTDMDAEVATYMKYKKETGRGFEDFLKLNKDYDEMDPDDLLREYISATQEGLDEEDVDVMMEEYQYDEDFDDDSSIKKIKLQKKKALSEAKKFFNEQKEKYRVPLESSQNSIPNEEREEYEAYRQYIEEAKSQQEEGERKRQWFEQKTNEVFNGEFKGFEFEVGDRKLTFKPGDTDEIKKIQSNPYNFINKFLDEKGLMSDAAGYHRSLAMALNPERFAKFFYEQGMSDATDDVTRKIKNVNMSERKAPEASSTGGVQVKSVNPDHGRGLKIRSAKKV
jgi:hypothetical protein